MGLELSAADSFINSQLTSDVALSAMITDVFQGQAPRGTLPPYIVFQFIAATDVVILGGHRIAVEPLYIVKVVGQTFTFADLQPMADLIDADLHNQQGFALGLRIAACQRQAPYSMTDTKTELPWRSLGGTYKLYISTNNP